MVAVTRGLVMAFPRGIGIDEPEKDSMTAASG